MRERPEGKSGAAARSSGETLHGSSPVGKRAIKALFAIGLGLLATVLLSFASRQLSLRPLEAPPLREPANLAIPIARMETSEPQEVPPETSTAESAIPGDRQARQASDAQELPAAAPDSPLIEVLRPFKAPRPRLGEFEPSVSSSRPQVKDPAKIPAGAPAASDEKPQRTGPLIQKKPVRESTSSADAAKRRIYGIGEVDQGAEPLATNRAPEYPRSLARRRRPPAGEVSFEFVIGPDGKVRNLVVTSSQGPSIFESVATEAIRGWRFEPARVDGRRVSMRAKKTIRFRGPRR